MPFSFSLPRGLGRLALLLAVGGISACAPAVSQDSDQAARVEETFALFKSAIFASHAAAALGHIDQPSLDYLQNASWGTGGGAQESEAEVRELIRRVIGKWTPGGIKPGFTLALPLQRVLNQGMMNTHDLDSIELGPVTVAGEKARAEVLWEGSHTTFQLAFVRQGAEWKIDLFNILPYAELALRMDRTMRNETEAQQVDRLVGQVTLP